MTVVSLSEIIAFNTCRRQHYYHYGLELSPAVMSQALKTGVFGHTLLENFYKQIASGVPKEEASKKLDKFLPPPDELEQGHIQALILVRNYIETLNLSGYAVMVEQSFMVKFYEKTDLWLAITPDLGWKRLNSSTIDVEDYKFTGKAWTNNRLSKYQQLNVYILVLLMLGWDVKRGYLRFFNTQSWKFSHKLYEPSKEVLANLRGDILEPALRLQTFKEQSIEEQKRRATRTLDYFACQWCDFVRPCYLEMEGKDASLTIKNEYVPSDYDYDSED